MTSEANKGDAAVQAAGDAQPASPASPPSADVQPARAALAPSSVPPAPSAANFASRDPGDASFWDERFERGVTPWDSARVPDAFAAFAARHPRCPVLIPGCGSAYEARWLARAGWPVRAIDFSAQAVAAARRESGADAALVEQADFFAYVPPFVPQWIYERAFLCAIPTSRRADYARHVTAYWDTGWQGVQINLSVGQYLAKDKGATLDISRRFRNGVVIGAYATKTNVSPAQFGEGSFDKGIYVTIPFDAMMTRSSSSIANLRWNPVTRDGGAKLDRRYPLYDLTDMGERRSLWYAPPDGAVSP